MRALGWLWALALGSLAAACGGTPTPSGMSCQKAAECPAVFCLGDGGVGNKDAGETGIDLRACVFGTCKTDCK